MNEIIEIILSYVSIWAPSLVAILGVVSTVLLAIKDVKNALNSLKADETLKDLKDALKKQASENEELIRCNKLLLDQLTKIRDYADNIKKEG